jgi:hypothetical protein
VFVVAVFVVAVFVIAVFVIAVFVITVFVSVLFVPLTGSLWECIYSFRRVKARIGSIGKIRACLLLVHNCHTTSEPLVQISFDHSHQFVRSLKLRGMSLLVWVEHMEPQMPLNQFGHQAIECAPAGRDELQNLFALSLAFQCALDGVGLPLDATNA